MTYVPKGKYLTAAQYAKKMEVTKSTVVNAVRDKRLSGIWIDNATLLIPEDAIMTYANIKHGKYIGVNAWIRGEIQHQEELKDWHRKQEILRRQRKNDD